MELREMESEDVESDESLDVDAVLARVSSNSKQKDSTIAKPELKRKSNKYEKNEKTIPLSNKASEVKNNYDEDLNSGKMRIAAKSLANIDSIIGNRNGGTNNFHNDKKHIASDQRRREALKKNIDEMKKKQSTIKNALLSLDSHVSSNKKVVFESDDEQEIPEIPTTARKLPTHNSQQTGKINLFETESASEEDDTDANIRFDIRPQFEGKSGKELFALQSRFGVDERFKIDSRFADNDNEDSEIADKKLEEVDEFAEERKKTLAVLEKVIGVKPMKQGKKPNARVGLVTHYDPTKQDHAKYEIAIETKKVKKAKEDSRKEQNKAKQADENKSETQIVALPPVSEEKFYEVSSELKDVFSVGATGKSFSFLNMFGNNNAEVEQNAAGHQDYIVQKISEQSNRLSWNQVQSSSDSDEEPADKKKSKTYEETSNVKAKSWPLKFFFLANDQRIQDGVEEFWRRDDEGTIKERWLHERPHIFEISRLRRKEALRREAELRKHRKLKHPSFKQKLKT